MTTKFCVPEAVEIEGKFYIRIFIPLGSSHGSPIFFNNRTLNWYSRAALSEASTFNDIERAQKYVDNFRNNLIGKVNHD